MNRMFGSVKGNKNLISKLSRAIESNTLAHAYILEGSRGSGRHTLALEVIAALSCEARDRGGDIPCKRCSSCKKIFEGKSPDVISISSQADKVTIGVEAVRFLKGDIYIAPNDLNIKAYIIDGADTMTAQAQNAFLLSLEEPPPYVLFFLICENSSALLETVKSRAPILRMEKVNCADVEEYIVSSDKRARKLCEEHPEDFKELTCASDGSIGYALELLDAKKRKQVFDDRKTAKSFVELASKHSSKEKIELVLALGTKRQEICDRLVLIQYAIRDLIVLKKSDDAPLCFYEDRETTLELSTHFTSKKLFTLYSACESAIDDLSKNANVRLTLMNMLKNADLI